MRVEFGSFVFDLDTRQLSRNGAEVHLTPKAFDLLGVLIDERPKVLSKAILLERVWPGTFVVEANLSNLVAEIRAVLGDRPGESKWIRTAHGLGYAFCGQATSLQSTRRTTIDEPMCWLEWGQRRFALGVGEHIVGRDPEVQVRLDASTVSRRHAKLIVTADRTSIEDLGSKNGTQRGHQRVTSAVQLADGDCVHIGSVLLTYHVGARATTTVTQGRSRSALR
jgi:DNA-binding winged helix-turn-helix (wHTH) protein